MDNDQFKLLLTQIDERVKSIDSRRIYYRKMAGRAFFSTIIMAAISTVLLGLHIDWLADTVRILVLILTTLITLINTISASFNYKDLWIANNDALNRFYALKFSMDFFEKSTLPVTEGIMDGFRNEYQAILNELNQGWNRSRRDNHK
jgi:hypothetical protein